MYWKKTFLAAVAIGSQLGTSAMWSMERPGGSGEQDSGYWGYPNPDQALRQRFPQAGQQQNGFAPLPQVPYYTGQSGQAFPQNSYQQPTYQQQQLPIYHQPAQVAQQPSSWPLAPGNQWQQPLVPYGTQPLSQGSTSLNSHTANSYTQLVQVNNEARPPSIRENYVLDSKVLKLFNEKMADVILLLRKFFASRGTSLTVQEANGLIEQMSREMKQATIQQENYLLRDYAPYDLLSGIAADEWEARQPQHTLLYNLLRTAVAYEHAGPQGSAPHIIAAIISFPLATYLTGVLLTSEINPTIALALWPAIWLLLYVIIDRPLVNLITRPAFEDNLAALINMVRMVYDDIHMDDSSRAYIFQLCSQQPVPRAIREVFDHLCQNVQQSGS